MAQIGLYHCTNWDHLKTGLLQMGHSESLFWWGKEVGQIRVELKPAKNCPDFRCAYES
jgi:hypothetical protein